MGRCTPYEKALKRHKEQAPPPAARTPHVARDIALGTVLARADATGGCVYSVLVPLDGIVHTPHILADAVAGEVLLTARYNGESILTLPIAAGTNKIDMPPRPVKRGDQIDVLLSGGGRAENFQLGFFLRR